MATAKKPITRSTDPNVRKSPPLSASQFPEGHVSKGNDGNYWTISGSANGVKRWVPTNKTASKSSSTKASTTKTASIKLNPLVKIDEIFEDKNGKLMTITKIDYKNNYVEYQDEIVGTLGAYFDSINEAINDGNWTHKPSSKVTQAKTVSSTPAVETQQEALDRFNTYINNTSNIYYTLPRTNIVVYLEDIMNITRFQALIGNTVLNLIRMQIHSRQEMH